MACMCADPNDGGGERGAGDGGGGGGGDGGGGGCKLGANWVRRRRLTGMLYIALWPAISLGGLGLA